MARLDVLREASAEHSPKMLVSTKTGMARFVGSHSQAAVLVCFEVTLAAHQPFQGRMNLLRSSEAADYMASRGGRMALQSALLARRSKTAEHRCEIPSIMHK